MATATIPIPRGAKVVSEEHLPDGRIVREFRYDMSPGHGAIVRPALSPRVGVKTHRAQDPRLTRGVREEQPLPLIRAGRGHHVYFEPGAVETIKRLCFADTDLGRQECGGYLFGRRCPGGSYWITAATRDVNEATEESVTLEMEPIGSVALGCWHSHPDAERLAFSDTDLIGISLRALRLERRTLSMLFGRIRRGWRSSDLMARGIEVWPENGHVVGQAVNVVCLEE